VKQSVYDRLKIEKVCIAAKSVDPCDPHKERVLHRVNQTKDDHNLALYIPEGQTIVQGQSEELQRGVQKCGIVAQHNMELNQYYSEYKNCAYIEGQHKGPTKYTLRVVLLFWVANLHHKGVLRKIEDNLTC
jgi:hypothetical protein